MLKALFIDLVPYVIDEQKMFTAAWKASLSGNLAKTLENPKVIELTTRDLNLVEVQTALHNYLVDEQEWQTAISNYKRHLLNLNQALFSNFKLDPSITKLFSDAEKNQCLVIIMSSHTDYLVKLQQLQFFSPNVSFLETSAKSSIGADDLFKYTSEHDISIHEFLCLTQEPKTIADMLENGYFCATININEFTDNNLYVINSLADLDFESVRYNFYESIGDESEDL